MMSLLVVLSYLVIVATNGVRNVPLVARDRRLHRAPARRVADHPAGGDARQMMVVAAGTLSSPR